MTISRRGFLKAVGASVLVLGAGGTGWVLTRSPDTATQPWQTPGEGLDDDRLQALSFAILAPNPHNRQPWLVKLVGEETVEVYCQLDRRLPATDPFDRQITIGLGCFIGLYEMAAARLGYEARVEAFPQGEPQPRLDKRPVARIALKKAVATNEPLWEQVGVRRSNKEPFDTTRPLAAETVRKMLALARVSAREGRVGFTVDKTQIARLRSLSFAAFEMESRTARTMQESIDVMRIGKAEIDANPDGIDIGGAFPEALNLVGVLTRANLADPKSGAFAQTVEMYREIMTSGMGYLWLTTPGNSRREQLQAGGAWLRLNLAASHVGLAFHPISQSLQEFPEMARLHLLVHEELRVRSPERLQMLVRLGYGPEVPPSPRWPLQTRIVRA